MNIYNYFITIYNYLTSYIITILAYFLTDNLNWQVL